MLNFKLPPVPVALGSLIAVKLTSTPLLVASVLINLISPTWFPPQVLLPANSNIPHLSAVGEAIVRTLVPATLPISGEVVPIPTLPPDVIRTFSVPAVLKANVSDAALNIPVLSSPLNIKLGEAAVPTESIDTNAVPARKTVPTPPLSTVRGYVVVVAPIDT